MTKELKRTDKLECWANTRNGGSVVQYWESESMAICQADLCSDIVRRAVHMREVTS